MESTVKQDLFLTHVGEAGGAELKVMRICDGLDKKTLEFMVFNKGSILHNLKDRGIQTSILPMPKTLRDFQKEAGILSVLKTIPSVISMLGKLANKCQQYDRIICISQKSFILAALTKPLHRKPIIWFMNDILSEEQFSKTLILLLTKLFRLAPDHIIVNSEASLQAWIKAGGRKNNVHIIYPGNDVQDIEKQLEDRESINAYKKKFSPRGYPLIGIFGRLSAWKGQDVFIKAISEIEEVAGVIVGGALFGEEAYENELKELAVEANVHDRLVFAGHIKDVVKAMAACDIVAHCSTAPEPFGSVITEAQLADRPVVVTKAGGALEIVLDHETGYLTPPGSVPDLVSAIEMILRSSEKTKIIWKSLEK